jgi:hypothetical protein
LLSAKCAYIPRPEGSAIEPYWVFLISGTSISLTGRTTKANTWEILDGRLRGGAKREKIMSRFRRHSGTRGRLISPMRRMKGEKKQTNRLAAGNAMINKQALKLTI